MKPTRALALPLLLTLAGCASDYAELRKAAPEAGDYRSTLASEYLSFAESEAEQRYWAHAEYFARKGRDALAGKPVAPEDPAQWSGVPPSDLPALQATRERVLALTGEDARRIATQRAARAQVMYDCWIVQETRGRKLDATYPCQNELASTLESIKSVLAPLPGHVEEEQ
jgi:hypothetical protein